MGLFDWIFANGEEEKGRVLDEELDALNRRRLEEGKISEAEYARRQGEIVDGAITGSEVQDAFNDEIVAQVQDLPGTVRKGLSTPVEWGLRAIPWWGWLLALFWVLNWLGGGKYLKGIIARRK